MTTPYKIILGEFLRMCNEAYERGDERENHRLDRLRQIASGMLCPECDETRPAIRDMGQGYWGCDDCGHCWQAEDTAP